MQPGTLYIVATPIGNLGDLSPRALEVLSRVDVIAAEDTRHSRPLLTHFGIDRPLLAVHEHNEAQAATQLIQRLRKGESIALISDAGTPLISDPGYVLVQAARDAGINVVPVPGPSALICALSAAGLPTDRFRFEGFLPRKGPARRARLTALARDPVTLVFYESSHRIEASITDMAETLGGERRAVIARELTKTFEQFACRTLAQLPDWLAADARHLKGEFVVMVGGAAMDAETPTVDAETGRVLSLLLRELPAGRAASLAAQITGCPRRLLYARAQALAGDGH